MFRFVRNRRWPSCVTPGRVIGLCLTLSAAPAAHATVMDFNGLPVSPFGIVTDGASITQNGYTITDTTPGTFDFNTQFEGAASGWQSGRGTDNGTTTVGMESANSSTPLTFTLTRNAGAPFDFISIDIGSLDAHNAQFHNTIATVWTFTGNLKGGGTVSQTINTNPDSILTYDLNPSFQDLTSVEVTAELPVMGITTSNGAGVSGDFDNIVVAGRGPIGNPVPEPATLLLLSGGVAGVRILRRRKGAR